MAQFNLPEGWTIKGNQLTSNQNAVLSVLEAQLRAELVSDKSSILLRLPATESQIIEMAGVGYALYRVTCRVMWGSTWDELEGTKRQLGQVKVTDLKIDQKLTIDFNIPEFDIERFLKSPSNIGAGMVANWTASFTRNLYENLEVIFLQGVTDYAIAKSLVLPINLLNLTADEAVEAYWSIWKKNNALIKKVDDITMGTNRGDLIGAIGIDGNLNFSKAFVRLNLTNIAPDTLVTGRRYGSAIAGMEFYESFFMEQNFNANDKTALHLENSYDLSNTLGFVTHKQMWGMPLSFTKMRSKLSDDADNVRIIGKCLYALPTAIRPDLMYVIMPEMPTLAQIQAAQLKDQLTNPDGKNLTFHSTLYDNLKILNLKNIIYFTDLGEFEEKPTADEINNKLLELGNNGFDKSHVDVTDITNKSALVKAKNNDTQYYNQVTVTFKVKNKKKNITEIIKVTDLSSEVVPVAKSTDRPLPTQIVNSVITLNSGATINDFNVSNVSVINFPIEKDDPKNPTPGTYINGDYTAIVVGAGKYDGEIDIKGKFGRLNP